MFIQSLTEKVMIGLDLLSLKIIKQNNLTKYNESKILELIESEKLNRYELDYILLRFFRNIRNKTNEKYHQKLITIY